MQTPQEDLQSIPKKEMASVEIDQAINTIEKYGLTKEQSDRLLKAIINNELQEHYDRDPEAYEIEERQREENRQQEQEEMARWREAEEERIQSEQDSIVDKFF